MNFPLRKEESARIESKRFAAEPPPVTAFGDDMNLDPRWPTTYSNAEIYAAEKREDAQTEAYAEGRKDQREEDAKRDAIEDLIAALPLTKDNLVWLCKRLDVMANKVEFDRFNVIDNLRWHSIAAVMAAEACELLRAGE